MQALLDLVQFPGPRRQLATNLKLLALVKDVLLEARPSLAPVSVSARFRELLGFAEPGNVCFSTFQVRASAHSRRLQLCACFERMFFLCELC